MLKKLVITGVLLIMVDALGSRFRMIDDVVDDTPNYSDIWAKLYQTDDSYLKKKLFREHMDAPKYEPMITAIDSAFTAFKGDLDTNWMSQDQFKDLLYHTSRHESFNYRDHNKPKRRQDDGGPARSWFQVEPDTARDMVTAHDRDTTGTLVNPRVSNQYWGPQASDVTGFSAEDIYNMSDDELGKHLETNDVFGAAMAMAKYLKAYNLPFNQRRLEHTGPKKLQPKSK